MRGSLCVLAGLSLTITAISGAQSPPPVPPVPTSPATPAAAPAVAPTSPAVPTPPTAPLVSRDEALELGRITFERAFAGNLDSLLATADPALGSAERLRERLETGLQQLAEQVGGEAAMIEEKVMLVNGTVQYWRRSDYSEVPVPLIFRVIMGPAGKWRGFTANTVEQTPVGTEILP